MPQAQYLCQLRLVIYSSHFMIKNNGAKYAVGFGREGSGSRGIKGSSSLLEGRWLPQGHGYLEDPACALCFLCFDPNLSGSIIINYGRGEKLVSSLAGEFQRRSDFVLLGTNVRTFGGDIIAKTFINTMKTGKIYLKFFFLSVRTSQYTQVWPTNCSV